MLQSQMGSAVYAHGAIALWENDILIAVLKQHNTLFDGEDLQMGVILHSFNQALALTLTLHVALTLTLLSLEVVLTLAARCHRDTP